ncbi:hypothetical protein QLH51_03335 [Sphingomonas sp. 2R-10]|uniref:hypothetical protein n=1 Tax=Sphingomonas sp. 2R-10 TaxID=3045148 RepID=UPI000F7AFD72|nr:hypothetical protein [Sphingomonas sp. 2R-10]MDJ0275840.1 hypothetical protein [Sphingomonas sp. 2R-10]
MRHLATLAVLFLAACNGADQRSAPGGVTQDEAAALNDAAAMLDDNALDANAIAPDPKERP